MAQKNIIITGAGGLVGPLLASRLLNSPEYRVILTDVTDPIIPSGVTYPSNAVVLKGDITQPEFVASLVAAAQPLHAVFIFHGIMSAGSEANFELSLRVNVDSIRVLTDTLRTTNPGVRIIYASSLAVYGQPLPEETKVTDEVTPTPQTTYGAHKLMNEIYLNELHRRGFLDVFVARFPTISVRPGKPTAAASSFLSGIIREPMNGQEWYAAPLSPTYVRLVELMVTPCSVIPIRDRNFKSYLASPRTIAENLIRVLNLDSHVLPRHIRHVNFPGISVSIQEMLDALAKFGGQDKLALVKEVPNAESERILRSWPQDFDTSTPVLRLGLVVDVSGEDLVREYIETLSQ